MKTLFSLLVTCVLVASAEARYSGGTGEPNNPYRIATAEDLMLLGETPEDYDKHFILTADIDLDPNLPGRKVFDRAVIASDTDDVTGGFQGTAFTGAFDGNDHTISHLTIEGERYIGLFGKLGFGARISNLGLDAVDVIGGGEYVGSLVGCIGEWYGEDTVVTNCYSTGLVSGTVAAGLVGTNNGSITSSYSTCLVSGSGGLVGMNNGSISSSYSTGSVSGQGYVGGLVGVNWGSITSCCTSGSVTGEYVGGLVGLNGGSILSGYSTGSVSGNDSVGGLVGRNVRGNITSCYSTGAVTGGERVGGLVGSNGYSVQPGSVTASFWDIETSGQSTSAGGTGLTTSEMQDISTYLSDGWDFVDEVLNGTCDYWQISTGDYPRLRCQSDEILRMPEGLGTAEQPYLIRDANDLATMWLKPRAHYRVEASLDLSGTTWSMPVVPWFGGTFEGNGHVISSLHIEGGGYLGLFGQLGFGARISNLGLEAIDISGTGGYVGGLAGYTGDWYAPDRIMVNCYSTGSVSGAYSVGGLVGLNSAGSSITSCYSNGSVSGSDDSVQIGGLVGLNAGGSITSCSSTCEVSGHTYVGGLVGGSGGDITNSNSTGSVSGHWSVGGLAGTSGGDITNSYSTGAVIGSNDVGGLVGDNDGSIASCYSTGSVNGTGSDVGGLVGENSAEAGVMSCFWDIVTSGRATSAGGTGLTTAEMQSADTFLDAGWDFIGETENGTDDIWWIDEGRDYPRLAWEREEAVGWPVVELDAAGFDAAIAEGVILVDFYATWCPHCTTQAPILEEVADRLEGRARVGKLDVDKARSIAQRYGVTAIPTLILFRDGVEVTRFIGVTSADVLVAAILAADLPP